MRRFQVIVVAALAMLIATPAAAVKVVGKIVITREFRESLAETDGPAKDERLKGYWNEPNGLIPVQPPRVDASKDLGVVIFREGADPPGPDKLSTIEVRASGLERNVIVTRPKSTIRLRSVDPFDHELYSPDLDSFRPERQAKDAFRPIEFSREGVYHIRCKLMPHFNAYVLVTNATLIAKLDRRGNFTIEDAEPGKYVVKVFHRGKWIHEQGFEIKDEKKQKDVRLEIKLKPLPKKAAEDGGKGQAESKAAAKKQAK